MSSPIETRSAILGSIAKWKAIVEGIGYDNGTENCALCELFYGSDTPYPADRCVGCPVLEKTSFDNCVGSPYSDWAIHQVEHHDRGRPWSIIAGCTACERLARAELEFLENL